MKKPKLTIIIPAYNEIYTIQEIIDKIKYEKVVVDDTFPEYIFKNKEMFKDWIV